eukprot:15325735-Alexandrium_andersonii.AAC.1
MAAAKLKSSSKMGLHEAPHAACNDAENGCAWCVPENEVQQQSAAHARGMACEACRPSLKPLASMLWASLPHVEVARALSHQPI